DVFSGAFSLSVTPFQRYRTNLPGWHHQIAEDPQSGEYRYLRFAWKRTEGEGILLQFLIPPKSWKGYYAGTLSKHVKQPMIQVSEQPPRQWEVVTRDLFADFGSILITGINFAAMEKPGTAYFDHIYLGRTIAD